MAVPRLILRKRGENVQSRSDSLPVEGLGRGAGRAGGCVSSRFVWGGIGSFQEGDTPPQNQRTCPESTSPRAENLYRIMGYGINWRLESIVCGRLSPDCGVGVPPSGGLRRHEGRLKAELHRRSVGG